MLNLINQLSLLRFNYTLPLHQKATKNKIYKKWSEAKFSSQLNLLLLLGFSVGVFSGLGVTLPSGVWSFISGEPVMNKVSSSGVQKGDISIRNGIISYTDYGSTSNEKKFYDIATQRHIEETSLPENWGPVAMGTDPVLISGDNLVVKDAETQISHPIASSENVDKVMADGSFVVWRSGTYSYDYSINFYDLSLDSDSDGTPNYKEDVRPDPDPAYRVVWAPGVGNLYNFELSGNKIAYVRDLGYDVGVFVYDISSENHVRVFSEMVAGTVHFAGNLLYIGDSVENKILTYNLSLDSDNNGIPNYKEEVRPDPDPAKNSHPLESYFWAGASSGLNDVGFHDGIFYFGGFDLNYSRAGIYSYDPIQNLEKKISDNRVEFFGGITVEDGKIVFISSRDNNNPEVFYTSLIEDSTEPYFVNLPNSTQLFNLTQGQIIQQSDLDVKVRPQDATSQISKVIFYLDSYELGVDYSKDASGVFSANIPIVINKSGGVTIRARAYDQAYNYKETSVIILPDPMIFPYINTQKVGSYVEGEGSLRNAYFENGEIFYTNENSLIKKNFSGEKEEILPGILSGNNLRTGLFGGGYACPVTGVNELSCFDYNSSEPIFTVSIGNTNPPVSVTGGSAYWIDSDEANYYFYKKDLGSGPESEITTVHALEKNDIVISDLVVTESYLYFNKFNYLDSSHSINRINVLTGVTQVVVEQFQSLKSFSATDSSVAYVSEVGGDDHLLYKKISENNTTLIAINSGGINGTFVTDNYLAWEDDVPGASERMVLYDIARGKKIFLTDSIQNELTGNHSDSDRPYIFGNKVFWNYEQGDGKEEIYMAELSYADIIKPVIVSVDGLFGTTGETTSIRVSATDNVKATRAKISVKGGSFVDMDGFESPFTYSLSIPADNSNNIPVAIRVYDIAGNNVTGQYSVEVADNDTPFVASIEGNRVTTGEPTTVKVRALDNIAINRIDINIDNSGFKPMKLVSDRYEYFYTAPTNRAGNFNMKIRIVDSSGVLYEKSNAVMTVIDNDPPEITNISSRKVNGNDTEIIVVAIDNIAPVRGMITVDNVLWVDMVGASSPFTYTLKNRDLRLLDNEGRTTYYVRVFDAAGNYDTTEPNKVPYVNSLKKEDEERGGLLTELANIATSVQGVIRDIAKKTPAPIARSFPFVLFGVLVASGLLFLKQASAETEQIGIKQQILAVRKSVADEKTNFVMLASHYIRTPVTIIVGGIDSLLKKYPLAKQAEIKALCKDLVQKTTETVAEIENNPVLNEINSPDIKRETFKIYLSPFFILPIVIVAGLTGFAVTVFEDAQVYKASTLELITYGLFFVIAVQIFGYFFRKRAIQKDNLAYFDRTIEYQLEMDEARVKFMVKVKTDLEKALNDLKKSLEGKSNKMTNEGFGRMEVILEKMGYLSTLKIDHAKKTKKSTPLNSLVNQAIRESREEIQAKKVSVKRNGLAVRTHQNEEVVTKILTEVLGNAVKFSPVNGEVVVEAVEKQSGIEIKITDSGKGISAKDQEFLFKPFSRAKSALDFDYEGIGLGLYYARSLSNMLGGDLSLTSATGKGTKITIIL